MTREQIVKVLDELDQAWADAVDVHRIPEGWPRRGVSSALIAIRTVTLSAPPAPAEGEREAALEEAAKRAEAEEELDGPMPETVAYAVQRDPINALRGAVRATKKGIAAGIRALKAASPRPPSSPDPARCRHINRDLRRDTNTRRVWCVGCGEEMAPATADAEGTPLPAPSPDPACKTCGGSQMVGTGQPSDEGGEAWDRCPDCLDPAPAPSPDPGARCQHGGPVGATCSLPRGHAGEHNGLDPEGETIWWPAAPPAAGQPTQGEGPKPRRSCNRHDDCDAADARSKAAHEENMAKPRQERRGSFPYAEHCHDDDCEDCFGR